MSRPTTILISLCGVFLIGFFWLSPQYQNLKNLNLKIGEKKAELQHKEEYYSNLKKISEESKNYESELSKIDSALPLDPSLPSLFNFLEKTAAQNGLILKNFGTFSVTPSATPSEEQPEITEIKSIYLDITVAGSYPALKNFLSALEKTARFVEAENISFSSPKEKEPFSFNLTIKAHSY